MSRPPSNEDKYVAWKDVPSLIGGLDGRVRRVEYGVIALVLFTGGDFIGLQTMTTAIVSVAGTILAVLHDLRA